MKVEKMAKTDADKVIKDTPRRVVGQWKALLEDLQKSGEGAKITGLTRGQTAALIRQCKDSGFSAVATDKYTAVIVSPKEAKKQK